MRPTYILLLAALAALPAMWAPADAEFSGNDIYIMCDPQGMVDMSWSAAPGHDIYYLYISRSDSNFSIYTEEVRGGKTSHTVTAAGSFGGTYRGDLFRFTIAIKTSEIHTDFLDSINTTFTCQNRPPTVSAGTDQTVGVNTAAYLAGRGSDPHQDPLTYTWACSYADGTRTIPVTQHSVPVYAEFKVPNVPNGTQITCTITASDGHNTVSDSVIVTAESTWDGTPADQDTQDTQPTQTTSSTPPEQTSQDTPPATPPSTPTSTVRSFTIPPSLYSPSQNGQSTPAAPATPDPPVLPLHNGTLPGIRMHLAPLNATHWNGTSTTPFHCSVAHTGSLSITGLNYTGMVPYQIHTTNVTNATLPGHTLHNMTVHAVSAYDLTMVEPYGALFGLSVGLNHTMSVFPATLNEILGIYGMVDVEYVQQFGRIYWEGAGAHCWTAWYD